MPVHDEAILNWRTIRGRSSPPNSHAIPINTEYRYLQFARPHKSIRKRKPASRSRWKNSSPWSPCIRIVMPFGPRDIIFLRKLRFDESNLRPQAVKRCAHRCFSSLIIYNYLLLFIIIFLINQYFNPQLWTLFAGERGGLRIFTF